jgi:hypothetical protein
MNYPRISRHKENDMRSLRLNLAAIAVSACLAAPYANAASVNFELNVAPPPPQHEEVPPPREGYTWAQGYWDYDNGKHTWRQGHWEKDHPGERWANGGWNEHDGKWELERGHWDNDRGHDNDHDGDRDHDRR